MLSMILNTFEVLDGGRNRTVTFELSEIIVIEFSSLEKYIKAYMAFLIFLFQLIFISFIVIFIFRTQIDLFVI